MEDGRRRTAQLSRWLLGLAIAGSALAVGTVHTVTLCIVAVGLAAAAGLAWWDAEPMSPRPAATLLVVTGTVLTTYTALQCVPMPLRWLAVLAPHNADVWSRSLAPLHELGPSWAPITLDPIATRVEVLKGIAYLLAFVAALRIARQREGARFLGGALVLTGLALALAALLHPAFGAHKLFGLYQPGPGIDERHIAPLLNPNNLAEYLNVALCLALGATFAREPPVPRPVAAAMVLLLGATQLWVASRAGVVAMALGVLVTIAVAQSPARPRGGAAVLSLITGLLAAAGAAMIVLAGSEDASSELLQTDTSKLKLVAHAMRMLPAVPVFGCGRGAFGSAFSAFRVDPGYATYQYPENVLAQWTLEWGLPLGLGGLGAVAFALRPGTVLARSNMATGAWAALVALAVQNLADLGSEIPAVALAGVVCAAVVVAGTPGRKPRWQFERWAKAPRAVAVGGAGAAVLGITMAASGSGHESREDQRALYQVVAGQPMSAGAFHGLERSAMLRHPAEPYLPFIAALRASRAGDESALPWLGATLERASVYGPAHLLLARLVAPRSPSQARMEYRLAIEQAPEIGWVGIQEAPAIINGYDDAMEVVPGGTQGIKVIELLVEAVHERLPATSVRLDSELVARDPAKVEPAVRAAEGAVDDVEAGDAAPWCGGPLRAKCLRDATDQAVRALRLAPGECQPYALRARARAANGEAAAGLKELQAATDGVGDRVYCLKKVEEIANAAGDEVSSQAALDQIVSAGCGEDDECARNVSWVAHEEEVRGYPRKALVLYKRALERVRDDDWILENVARLAAEAELHAEAAEDYERLAVRHPADARWKKAVQAEREAAARGAARL